MKLLPYDTFTVTTHQSLECVIDRLAAQIEAPQKWRWNLPRHHAPYTGTLSESGFEIRRIIHYRNSFLPNIRGRFESSAAVTIVRIQQRLHPVIVVFALFWLSTWYSIAIPICISGWLSEDIGIEMLLPLGMPIVVFSIFGCVFWWEADRSRRELTAIILGRSPESQSAKMRSPQVPSYIFKILTIAAILIGNAIALHLYFSSSNSPNSSPTQLSLPSQPFDRTHPQPLFGGE